MRNRMNENALSKLGLVGYVDVSMWAMVTDSAECDIIVAAMYKTLMLQTLSESEQTMELEDYEC